MRRAYHQKVLLCFQMPFTYGMGKGEASSVFYVLHHMKQVAIQAVLLETDRPSLGGDRAAFLHGGSIPLCQGQIFVTIWARFY